LLFSRLIMSNNFHVVASRSEFSDGQQMYVELHGHEILLCLHKSNFYAISYFCSHGEFALEGGTLRNGCITCPYHGAEFSLKDGSVQAPPADEPIKTYPVRVENDTISICISNPAPQTA
jgi:3-phenylpropionate/trans-cinnamate dioxygenase ferredoxin subunit